MRPCSLACLVIALCGASAAFGTVQPPQQPALGAAIPRQSVADALDAFAQMTGIAVDWPSADDAAQSPGAPAGAIPARALEQLLHCTGLTFRFVNPRAVHIERLASPDPACAPPPPPEPPLPQVTIQTSRWEHRVTEVPVHIDGWDPARVEASGVSGIADIAALAPGVSFDFFSSVGSGIFTDLVIRGVSDRHGSATGIFFDDVPLPAARSNTFGRALPPVFDLSQTEILHGSQGTLLGAETQGGAVRFTPTPPNLRTYSGLAEAQWAVTERGRPSYEFGAAAGGPLAENTLGFRLSAWQRSDGGYVNRVDALTPGNAPPYPIIDADSNRLTTQSVHAALGWDPSHSVHVIPSFSYVSAHAPDSPSFFTYLSNPGAGELNNGSLIAQPFDDTYAVASLRVIADSGSNELDSRTSYYHRKGDLIVDDTQSAKWGGWGNELGAAFPSSPDNAVTTYTALRQSVFSQELRLSSPEQDRSTVWVAGASYYRTRDVEAYHVTAARIAPPAFAYVGPLDAYNSTPTVQTRLGVFGKLSQVLTGHFILGAGLRVEYEQYEGYQTEAVAPVTPAQPVPPQSPVSGYNTVVAPLVSLTYKSGPDEYYLKAARGYAPAGVDAALPTCFENLSTYPTDTLWSYELGTSLTFADPRFALTAALFDARWDNGPALSHNCLVTHIPGSAVSRGFDLAGKGSFGHLQARLEVSYVDAHYTQTSYFNGYVIAHDGDALGTPPLVASPWSVLASFEQELVLHDGAKMTLRAEDAFHSRNPGPFYTGIPQPEGPDSLYAPRLGSDPSINLLNLRVAVHLAAARGDELAFALFVNNALDSQPTLLKRNKGADDQSMLFYASTFRPRTVGLSGTWSF